MSWNSFPCVNVDPDMYPALGAFSDGGCGGPEPVLLTLSGMWLSLTVGGYRVWCGTTVVFQADVSSPSLQVRGPGSLKTRQGESLVASSWSLHV